MLMPEDSIHQSTSQSEMQESASRLLATETNAPLNMQYR